MKGNLSHMHKPPEINKSLNLILEKSYVSRFQQKKASNFAAISNISLFSANSQSLTVTPVHLAKFQMGGILTCNPTNLQRIRV